MRHDFQLKSWIIQRNRKKRQNEVGPVVFALLQELTSTVSPATVPTPVIHIEGGTNYESLTWSSSDRSIIDFDSSTPVQVLLKAPGTATVTVTFNNANGSTYSVIQAYTIT